MTVTSNEIQAPVTRFTDEALNEAFGVYQSVNAELTRSVEMPGMDRQMLVAALMVGGAVLLEGPPGTGKTFTAKAMAEAIGGTMRRTQGSADIRPMDITGARVWHDGKWEFQQGPIFSNVYLADEANRNSPKAQAALLEAMEEKQVTIANETYELPKPFLMLASENPEELEQGVTALLKALRDRFFIVLDIPAQSVETMLKVAALKERNHQTKRATTLEAVMRVPENLRAIAIGSEVMRKAASLVVAVRENANVDPGDTVLGGSRPLLNMLDIAKVIALSKNRQVAEESDVAQAALYVLPHRVGLTFKAENDGLTRRDVVAKVVNG